MTPTKWKKVKTKSLLFFILGIVGISISLLFSSCGSGPMLKTLLSNLGVYAVDFGKDLPDTRQPDVVEGSNFGVDGLYYTAVKNHTSANWNKPTTGWGWTTYWVQAGSGGGTWTSNTYYDSGREVGFIGLGKSIPRLADMEEFTIEAWVKNAITTGPTLEGGIFSRANDNYGCVLFVNDNKVKFTMKPRATTSAAYIADSGFTLPNDDNWYHVAGVFIYEDHSAVHAACGTGNVGQGTSIAIGNSSDNLHISYYDVTNSDLKYATCPSTSDCTVPANWSTARLDIGGTNTSIALDSSDNLHISYYDSSEDGKDLKYTTCPSSGNCAQNISPPPDWSNVLVEGFGNLGDQNSIAIDSTGKIHIAYFLNEEKVCGAVPSDPATTKNDLRYATCDAGTDDCTQEANWSTTVVDGYAPAPTAMVGRYPSIAIDSSDNLHVSYYDEGNGALKYATCSSSCTSSASWTRTTVDTSGTRETIGNYSSLAIDSNGYLHISYLYTYQVYIDPDWITYGRLKYATCSSTCTSGSSWSKIEVDSGEPGRYTSLAIDSNDYLHISYYSGPSWMGNGTTNLKYATCSSGCTTDTNWTDVTVDSSGATGEYASLAIDSNNKLHISYYSDTSDVLRYATCSGTCTTGSNWDKITVDDGNTARGEIPHVDIYVNGVFQGCGTAFSLAPPEPKRLCGGGTETIAESNEQIGRSQIGWSGMGIDGANRLEGVIDEVRFWREVRTPEQINTWRFKEITVENWNQANPNNALIGYWKFNEGSGTAIHDFSGSQNSGAKNYCDYNCDGANATVLPWEGGWTDGYPF